MSAQIGDVAVRVGANISDLRKGMSDGSKSVGQFANKSGKELAKVAANIAKVGAAAIAAGTALVAGLYTKGAQVIDQQAKMARSLDSSVASVQALERAGKLAGLSQDGLSKASAQLNARLGEAMRGTGEAARQLDRLGLSAKELASMEADQRLAVLADRMVELGYNSAQAGDALRQLGIREREVTGLMLDGGEAFRSARKDVEEFGIAVSDVDAAQIEATNDAMTSIGATIQGISNTISVKLAPYLGEVAQRFSTLSRESEGFGSITEKVINAGLKGFGYLGNVLHGLRVAFKGVQLAGVTFGAAITTVIEGAMEGFTVMRDGVAGIVNQIIDALNNVPGIDIAKIDPFTDSPFMEGLRGMGVTARNEVANVAGELKELALQELPSAKINEFLADVAKRSEETAQAVVDSRRRMLAGPLDDNEEDAPEADTAALDRKLRALQDRFVEEHELLERKYAEDAELLQAALTAQRLTEDEHYELAKLLLASHQDELTAIEKRAADERAAIAKAEADAKRQIIGDSLRDFSTLMNTNSRKMFELGKASAISNAIINTHEGITSSLKLPFPYNMAAAAATAAKGFASVSAIRSQSFGGKGGASGSNTRAINDATTPVQPGGGQPSSAQGPATIINLQGETFGAQQVRDLIEQINESSRDGGRILLA